MSQQCNCGKGYASIWDNKCGHCRTKKEQRDHEYALDCVSDCQCESQADALIFYKEVRNHCK